MSRFLAIFSFKQTINIDKTFLCVRFGVDGPVPLEVPPAGVADSLQGFDDCFEVDVAFADEEVLAQVRQDLVERLLGQPEILPDFRVRHPPPPHEEDLERYAAFPRGLG